MRGDLVFYSNTDPFSRLIQWVTKSPYNHVAIDLGDGTDFAANPAGLKVYPIGKPDMVVHTSLLIDKDIMEKAITWLFQQEGKKYDYTDVVMNLVVLLTTRFHIPYKPPFTPQEYDCSELAATYLVMCKYPFTSDFIQGVIALETVSPGSLYRGVREVQHDV